jgi:hypothetical protein
VTIHLPTQLNYRLTDYDRFSLLKRKYNDSDMLNNLRSGYFNIGAASRKSQGLIQSGLVALLVSKIFSISSTSVSVMRICRSPSVCNSVGSGDVWSLLTQWSKEKVQTTIYKTYI